MAEENRFPTINDAIEVLTELAKEGFGELPIQIIAVPDSTIQALTKCSGAIMVDYDPEHGRLPVGLITVNRIAGDPMPTTSRN